MKELRPIEWFIIITAFLIGVLVRLPFLLTSLKWINSDQAMTGLMAIHILRGDFPIFWWGQGYMGPVDSYLTAIVTYIFGVSNVNSLIVPFFFSLFFPFTSYLLAREVFNKEVAILSFIFTSLPAWFFTVLWGYMIPISIGNLLLFLMIRFFKQKDSKEKDYRKYILVGFLAGLAFWINWMILPYLATVGLFIFLRDKTFFLKKSFLCLSLSFLVGSLPFWIFNLTHQFWTFALLHGEGQRDPIMAAKVIMLDIMPLFLGLKYTEYPWSYFTILLGISYGILLILLLTGIFKFKDKKSIAVLISFTIIVGISFILSRWGRLGSPRYLFQLYSVIPIFIGFASFILKERSRVFFYIISVIILSANLYAEVDASLCAIKSSDRDPDTKGLVNFLKSKDIRYAYSDYSLAPRLTYESKETIICAEPTTERYIRYKDLLDKAHNFAYVFRIEGSPLDLAVFEENIKAKAIGYKKDDVEAFRIFHSFSPPSHKVEIPRHNWSGVSFRGEEDVSNAFDGDIETAWFSGEPKRDGMWFRVDLGGTYRINGLSIMPGLVPEGNMNGYSAEVSNDGRNWTLVGHMDGGIMPWIAWHNGGPRYDLYNYHPRIKIDFYPTDARYIRITNHGKDTYFNWTIAEFFVFTPARETDDRYCNLIDEGKRLESQGDYRGAMKKYLDVLNAYGDIEEAYYRIMSLMQELHIPFGPYFEKAEAFEKAGLIDKAIENYENEYKRVKPSGSYGSILLNRLSSLYKKMGDTKKADLFSSSFIKEFSPVEKRSIDFGSIIEFSGYDLEGSVPEIVYYWKAIGEINKDWHAFVHFIGSDNKVLFQNDHILFSGDKPTSKWIKREFYKERFKIEVPEGLRSGTYTIRLGLWDPKTGEKLKAKKGLLKKKDEVTIGELSIIE